jgi:hypothetical protein
VPLESRSTRSQAGGTPVFDALQLLEPSPFGTYVAQVAMAAEQEQVARLAEVAAQQGGSAEDWSTSVRMLCSACSAGRPHDLHDTEAPPPPAGAHLIGIAARDRQQATAILSAWEASTKGIAVESLDEALPPGQAN